MELTVRRAERSELEQVNELRRMVNEVHVQGRPDIFRPGFGEAIQQHLYELYEAEGANVLVALAAGEVCGFALVEYLHKPETPYNLARGMYHVEEFGVSDRHRRLGVATALVNYMKQDAAARGFAKIELDMWEFNQGALAFYEAAGFETYRRYMELIL